MTSEEKKTRGRPRLGLGPTLPLQVRLTPEQHDWIISQNEGASELVRKWIDEAMQQDENKK